MAKDKNQKVLKNKGGNEKKERPLLLPGRSKRYVFGVLMFLIAAILGLSFFNLSGAAGSSLRKILLFLIGNSVFILPAFFVTGGFAFIRSERKSFYYPTIIAITALILGISGLMAGFDMMGLSEKKFTLFYSGPGGWFGHIIGWPIFKFFGFWVTEIIFLAVVSIGIAILWQVFYRKPIVRMENEEEEKATLIKKIFAPQFQVKEIEPQIKNGLAQNKAKEAKSGITDMKTRPIDKEFLDSNYQKPPLDLLEPDRDVPVTGDIRTNSAIIKKTLQNFDISVEMSEVNIGPTVTQYTFKPAEGVKLSKITGLSNDLSLALAAHPIRIEAPIPGRSLVGIEIPNKMRAQVRLRNIIETPAFQNATSRLMLVLGRDVSGSPVYADLARMPHLLVAGATGTGKTIFLNCLVLSLLYQNSPETLRLILIDPKRVEFPVYNELPHLLAPPILDSNSAVNAMKWLIKEMERRFEVLSSARARDIGSYNAIIAKEKAAEQDVANGKKPKDNDGGAIDKSLETMPYIVVVIDELADLMAARGRDLEASIVRLAQLSRAVGIHLVLATQRPSVEVITGLIKANVTSRVTFQVASQVDSRTVLDAAGAEKLLGLGDLLFVTAEVVKPKRVQGAYASEKEVRKVVTWIRSKAKPKLEEEEEGVASSQSAIEQDLKASLETPVIEEGVDFASSGGDDPLFEDAKRVVIEAKKASASLLQRRLRLGYARAARLIDMLEEKGIVGPGEGAKPREVYGVSETEGEAENPDEIVM